MICSRFGKKQGSLCDIINICMHFKYTSSSGVKIPLANTKGTSQIMKQSMWISWDQSSNVLYPGPRFLSSCCIVLVFHVIKLVSHCVIITESGSPRSVVQSDEICSDCFGLIVLIPLSVSLVDDWAEFLSDNVK